MTTSRCGRRVHSQFRDPPWFDAAKLAGSKFKSGLQPDEQCALHAAKQSSTMQSNALPPPAQQSGRRTILSISRVAILPFAILSRATAVPAITGYPQPTARRQRGASRPAAVARSAGPAGPRQRRRHRHSGRPAASLLRRPERAALFAARKRRPQQTSPLPPLGPPGGPMVTASAAPVAVQPPATLACPIVSALDQWITGAVQPAALRWFRQPVVEIKQISAYSCRGMNGNPNAHISEHAFGNALDVAEFDLADGHKVSVQYGWHGTPEEQGFLHDVQVGGVRRVHHRAGARRQRLSLQSHPRRSDAALLTAATSASPPRSPAKSPPSACGRASPRSIRANITAIQASPARSKTSRTTARSAIPARTTTVCRRLCRVRMDHLS